MSGWPTSMVETHIDQDWQFHTIARQTSAWLLRRLATCATGAACGTDVCSVDDVIKPHCRFQSCASLASISTCLRLEQQHQITPDQSAEAYTHPRGRADDGIPYEVVVDCVVLASCPRRRSSASHCVQSRPHRCESPNATVTITTPHVTFPRKSRTVA
jgi:hypothetical protein